MKTRYSETHIEQTEIEQGTTKRKQGNTKPLGSACSVACLSSLNTEIGVSIHRYHRPHASQGPKKPRKKKSWPTLRLVYVRPICGRVGGGHQTASPPPQMPGHFPQKFLYKLTRRRRASLLPEKDILNPKQYEMLSW